MPIYEYGVGNQANDQLHKQYLQRQQERVSTDTLNRRSASFNGASQLALDLDPLYGSEVQRIVKSRGVHNVHETGDDWFTKFSRFKIIDPYNSLKNTREFLFFTKPDLHIANHIQSSGSSTIFPQAKLQNNPFFIDAIAHYPEVVKQLQYSVSTSDGPFACMLSNAVNSPLDLSSLSSDNIESAANTWGTKVAYRGSSLKSDEENDFTLEFLDTKYLEVYMFFKMYDEYEKLKWEGLLLPDPKVNDDRKWIQYTFNKVLHDQISIYKMVVGEDGMSLVYWARITGVFPTGAPRDAFSDMGNSGSEGQRLSVPFHGFKVRDMDPLILQDFDNLVRSYIGQNTTPRLYPLWDPEINGVAGEFAGMPYVVSDTNLSSRNRLSMIATGARMQPYYLMWTY